MNTGSAAFLIVLVLAYSMLMLACAETGGNAEGKATIWTEMAVRSSGSIASNQMAQYFLTLTTNPPGIASPAGGGWYETGTNTTVSTQEFIDIDPGQSRYKFINWTTSDISEIDNPFCSTTSVMIDKAKTVTANYVLQFKVVFDQSGMQELPHTDTILAIDGVNHDFDMLPASFWYDNDSNHIFRFETSLIVTANKKAYVWTSTAGLSTAQSESITVSSTGNITGNYKTQYYLTVTSTHGTPNPSSGWFDLGTTITASIESRISGPTGTRYVCAGWSGKGSVPTYGSDTSTTFQLDTSSTLTWNWNTQYYVTVASDPAGLVIFSAEGWYSQSANVTLAAPIVTDYEFDYWAIDGASQGKGVNAITVTMGTAHTATAHYNAHAPPTLQTCDSSGLEKNTFDLGQDETVYVKGNGFSPSTTYAMHVVNAVVWVDGMDIPPRIADTSTTVMTDGSGSIGETVVWDPPLTLGNYDIIVDVNMNGKYDQDVDVLDVEQNAFSVIPEFSVPIILLGLMVAMLLGASCVKRTRIGRV